MKFKDFKYEHLELETKLSGKNDKVQVQIGSAKMNINIKCKRSLREKLPVSFLLPNISVILSVNNNRVIFILNKTTGKILHDCMN